MAGIFQIYKDDWRNLFRVPTAVLLIAALAVLPSVSTLALLLKKPLERFIRRAAQQAGKSKLIS